MMASIPPMLAEMGAHLLTAWTSSCSLPISSNEDSWPSFLLTFFQFSLLSSCPQRILISTLHLGFLGLYIPFWVYGILRRGKPSVMGGDHSLVNGRNTGKHHNGSSLLTTTCAVVLLVAIGQTGVAVWRVGYGFHYGWKEIPAQELLFSLSQALAWIAFVGITGEHRKFAILKFSTYLRSWWVVTCMCVLLTVWSAIGRFLAHKSRSLQLWVDDIVTLVTAPAAVFLLVLATIGVTGITLEENQLTEPLLDQREADGQEVKTRVATGYSNASFLSKLTWRWLNPLLAIGKSKPLDPSDVPFLAPDDQAEQVYARFKVNFDSQQGYKSAQQAIMKTYWPQLLFTALLALFKLSVMYVGPLLIAPISDSVAGQELFLYEGYVLVGILFLAKASEVLCSHHYNFFSNKLGMVTRSCLITALYRKGLKLTSHARQVHGAGQITNYMTIDAQMIADCIVQLHSLWVLPLQLMVALVILYGVLGISSVGGISTMVLTVGLGFSLMSWIRNFQGLVMKSKDVRMVATTEALNSMKIIKLQSWEEHFKGKIEEARSQERRWLQKFMYTFAVQIVILWQSPVLVATATFALCLVLGEKLTPSRVFTALSTFRIMQESLRLFPTSMMNVSQALNSFERLDKYFRGEELDDTAVERLPLWSRFAVEIEGGVFKWAPEEETPTLNDIDFKVEHGSLVAIVGMVGSGKSSLLSAVLGEVPKLAGKVKLSGTTAIVSQGAWIQNATIRENILFGKAMDDAKYQETLRVCALGEDMANMEFGDRTEIGERGINLSGGQKQRIQLARAVYQDTDIYLLDDVFSAVDAHTGSELFDKCIKGALGSKTVLLVTHQVEFLNGADLILVMRDGRIVQSGRYHDLLAAGTDLNALVAAHNEAMEKVETSDNDDTVDVSEGASSLKSPSLSKSSRSGRSLGSKSSRSGKSFGSGHLNRGNSKKEDGPREGDGKLVEDERRESGGVSWRLYWLYVTKTFYGLPFLALIIFQACFQAVQIAGDYYLANVTSTKNEDSFKPGRFIATYAAFGLGSGVFVSMRTFLLAFLGLRTSQGFFIAMLSRIFRAPMSFFDTTPAGRILTRFSNDQSSIDYQIPISIGTVLGVCAQALGILFVVCQVTWEMIFFVIPLAFVFISYQRYYIATSRELTRIDSVTKAPIIHHFSETIAGFVTIRAFQEEKRFSKENVDKVNSNLRMDFHNNAANEWLGFRLEMIGSTVLCLSALLMIAARSHISSDLVGLSLSYGLALNACIFGVVWLACQLENKMVAVERVAQYCQIGSEAEAIIPENRPPSAWPEGGSLHLQRLELRYRPDTPLVLKGVSLHISGGEKVGVVGRTGSGKSTLIQALFRLVEPAGGCIIIDGIDISTIGLKDLRSKLAIIPQEPTLFQGSVRFNLDPLGEHSDPEIWEGLERCQLAGILRDKEEKLDSQVQENGENWSVGQRQLFCLGRALLKHSRILVLDEATASVDAQTDVLLQNIIRAQFQSSTVISIAHRIPTVMDSDKVLVLDAGHVKEFDSPSRLLDQHSSLFAALVREYTTRSGSVEDLQAL